MVVMHPDLGIQLAHDLIAERHADAARARLIRTTTTGATGAESQSPAVRLVTTPPACGDESEPSAA
jgi:hypothetical protein